MKQHWHVSDRGDITITEPVNADGSMQRTVLRIPHYVLARALVNIREVIGPEDEGEISDQSTSTQKQGHMA
jgi:hypothetical protein